VFASDRPQPSPHRYSCIEDLLLDQGSPYEHTTQLFGLVEHEPGRRFANAFGAASSEISDQRLIYVEGYAVGSRVFTPTHHAWLTRPSGPGTTSRPAIYPTWQSSLLESDPDEEFAYFGIAFDLSWLRANFQDDANGVLDNWHNGHLRIHRDISQPPAEAFFPWHAYTDRVRDSISTDDGSLSLLDRLHRRQVTPEPPE
jgi:hypothetical protein